MNLEFYEPNINADTQRIEWSIPSDKELGEEALWLPETWGQLQISDKAMRNFNQVFGFRIF